MKHGVAIVAAMALMVATASADWGDSFTDYADGSQIVGQGGWDEWDPGAGGLVTSAQAHSAPHSLEIVGASDVVHTYSGYTEGQWTYTAWNYVPGDLTGDNPSHFILLNTFDAPTYNWSVQIGFDSSDGLIHGDCGSSNQVTMPYVTDQWKKIQVLIDLDEDWTQVYYDGQLFDDPNLPDHPTLGGGYSWTGGVFGGGGGLLNIGAVDLFAYGSSPVYYDAMSLGPEIPEPASCLLLILGAALGLRRR